MEALFLIQRPDIDQPAGEDDGSEHASLHLNCIYVNLIQLFLPRLQRLTFFPLLVSLAATISFFTPPQKLSQLVCISIQSERGAFLLLTQIKL